MKKKRDLDFFDFMKDIDLRNLIKTYIKVWVYLVVFLMLITTILFILISALRH